MLLFYLKKSAKKMFFGTTGNHHGTRIFCVIFPPIDI